MRRSVPPITASIDKSAFEEIKRNEKDRQSVPCIPASLHFGAGGGSGKPDEQAHGCSHRDGGACGIGTACPARYDLCARHHHDRNAHGDAYRNTYRNADCNTYRCSYGNAYGEAHGDTHSRTDCNAYRNAHSCTYRCSYRNTHSCTDCTSQAHCSTYGKADRYRHGDPDPGSNDGACARTAGGRVFHR